MQKNYSKGENHYLWKGGKGIDRRGYVRVRVLSGDVEMKMQSGGASYILEHRLVMQRYLGRRLKTEEVVHHLNNDQLDNRIENLVLMTPEEHLLHHWNAGEVRELNKPRRSADCHPERKHAAKGFCASCYIGHLVKTTKNQAYLDARKASGIAWQQSNKGKTRKRSEPKDKSPEAIQTRKERAREISRECYLRKKSSFVPSDESEKKRLANIEYCRQWRLAKKLEKLT